MFLHKLIAASHLAWLLLWSNTVAVAQAIRRGPRATLRELRHSFVRVWLGVGAGLFLRGRLRVSRIVRVCRASGVPRATLEKNLEAAVILAEGDVTRQHFERAVELLTPHIDSAPEHPRAAKCLAVRSLPHIWQGHHQATISDLNRCAALRPKYARGFSYLANLAQVHGFRGETDQARRAMATQCGALKKDNPTKFLTKYLRDRLEPELAGIPKGDTVGVMIGAYHSAFGHAILDPFHFYNLFRHRFDHLVIVHPPTAHYSRATALMVEVMQQYINKIEVPSGEVGTFAWQNLGELQSDDTTFLCLNYWSLNNQAFHARQNPNHPMSQGRRYVKLPPKIIDRAEVLCRKNRLDLSRPIVVLHVRSHGYHSLRVQGYRNVEARNYVPAARRLIELGYTVVRIGDRDMASIRTEVPGVIELPFVKHYDNVLDAYFLSRCEFMISCQSGPCSLARAMGKPNLVANAVYHHTMLPEHEELFLFKRYRDVGGRTLSLEEILARGGHLLDKTSHFETAGLKLEDATADEILAATEEMVAGLNDFDRSDTPAQAAFRGAMQRFAYSAPDSHPLASQLTNYIGYALPEARVSDAVCQMRPGYVTPPTRRAIVQAA